MLIPKMIAGQGRICYMLHILQGGPFLKQMAFYANKEANPLYPVPELRSYRKLVKIYYKIGKIDNDETMA